MALNQILDRSASTVVVSGDTGALANGRDVVTITVTAIDTSGDPIPNAEVFIEETSGNHFLSDSEMPQDPGGDGRLRGPDPVETDANGVGAVTLTSFHEGTLTFDVFVGAPQGGTGGASGAAVFNGNNVDDGGVYTQKTLAADVGASGGYTTTYNTDQTIDAAWLVANNGGSTSIQNTRFQNCTVTVTTEVQFNNCLFEGGSNDYALVVNLDSVALTGSLPTNYLLQDCTITGGAEAGLTGYRIHMIDCLIEECGKHGIKLTKRSGTGNEPVQIVRSVVRKVGDGGSSVQPQGYGVYAVDARYVTLRGMSVECPYHTTGGAIAGYYPEGAVYVGADTEPISHFFFYTSWIDGGVKLDDAGLGIGPEGQMFSPNMYGRNYNPAVPLFDTTDVPSLWTKGQMWMDTGALISNEEAGGNIRTFTGKKYNNLWASGAALDTQATFTLDPAYSLVTLDAFDQFGPFTTNLLDFPPRNNKFNQWTPATINSSPVPTVLAETPLPFPQTGTADRISYNNSAAFADGALVHSKEVGINAGDTVPYEVTVAAANGDGFKTLMALKDDSDQITEQATVAFSNVFAEDHAVSLARLYPNLGFGATTTSAVEDPDGGTTATRYEGAVSPRIELSDSWLGGFGLGREFTYSVYFLAEADTRRLELNLANHTSGGSVTDTVNAVFDISTSSGVVLSSFTSASSGPSYSSADCYRAEQVSGTDWWKVSVRIVDYTAAGNGAQTFVRFKTGSNATDNFAAWRHELRYGNHITGQQLLTVDDGVENLLRTVSVEDFSDFTTNGTVSTSSIAAPDGTLTAQDIAYTVTGATYIQKTAADYGSVWKLGAGWSSSFYFYQPTLPGNVQFDTYIYNSGGTQINNFRTTINSSGALIAFGGTAVYGPAFTSERNLDLRKIGDTGWYQVTVFIGDYGVAADEFLFIRLVNQTAGGTYTYWNPTLRYGDWVARGKNWLTTTDIIGSWLKGNLDDIQLSSEAAPDGTLSAVDVYPTVGSIGTVSLNQLTSTYGWPDDARYTWEFYIKHPLPVSSPTCYFNSTVDSTGGDEQWWPIIAQDGGFTGGTARNVTSGPGYSIADDAEAVAIGTDGWWRYRFSMQQFDTAATIFQIQTSIALRVGATGQKITIWNPRLTVGNPADARGYFVSGPQNLLGDGSDYSGWTAGTN